MKFVKVENHVYNMDCIFDLFYLIREDEKFNRKNFSYYIRTINGFSIQISQFEYNELEKILFSINYDNSEA